MQVICQIFLEKKLPYFWFWKILLLLWRYLVFPSQESFTCYHQKSFRMEFCSKPHYNNFSRLQTELPRDMNDRRSKQGVRLRNNKFHAAYIPSFFIFFWCNTVLYDTSTMEFSLYTKIFVRLCYNTFVGKK